MVVSRNAANRRVEGHAPETRGEILVEERLELRRGRGRGRLRLRFRTHGPYLRAGHETPCRQRHEEDSHCAMTGQWAAATVFWKNAANTETARSIAAAST